MTGVLRTKGDLSSMLPLPFLSSMCRPADQMLSTWPEPDRGYYVGGKSSSHSRATMIQTELIASMIQTELIAGGD